MAKETLRGKSLLRLTVSEGESMIIMAGSRQQAGRHGAGAVVESIHLDSQTHDRGITGNG